MSDVSKDLAAAYGNNPEDAEKVAQAQAFVKLCEAEGIKVEDLRPDQVEFLYKAAMEGNPFEKKDDKKAEEDKKKEEAEKKEAAARAEYEEKRATLEKAAEADAMGRIMAHAFVSEMRKLAGEMPPQFLKGKEEAKPEEKKPEEKKDEEKNESEKKADAWISAINESKKTASAAAPASSDTSNLDEQAAKLAVEMLKSAGVDPEVALRKIAAAYELGLGPSTKIATAMNFEKALEVRAYEYAEKAGWEVHWDKV